MIYGQVLCVGDSLLTGARDEYDISVPMLLGDALSIKGQKWLGIDCAVNGETSSSLLRHLYKTVRAYPEAKEVVICIGTNDAKEPALPESVFLRNYGEILKTLSILHRRALTCLVPQRGGFGAIDLIDPGAIKSYNEIILTVAGATTIPVDIRKVPSGFRPDGIHFDHRGNQWVAQKIAETIIKSRS